MSGRPRIADYGLIGDGRTGALISRQGSIDWFCAPRFDAASMFGAMLGDDDHGCWRLHPTDAEATATRRYDGDSLILITRWQTATGVAEVSDLLPIGLIPDGGSERTDIVRRIRVLSGRVEFISSLQVRMDYARAVPWMRQSGSEALPALVGTAGPDSIVVRGAQFRAVDHRHEAIITATEDDSCDLTLTWYRSYDEQPVPVDVDAAIARTQAWWTEWAANIEHHGSHHELVVRSLLTLRALTNIDTGGIVAAATTSLPESFGGDRNWDYRFVWLRDASLVLQVLVQHGFIDLAEHWRTWLLRAVAGDPSQVQIVYGIAGERDLYERELTSLPGFDGAAPVRIGNGAYTQYQADVIGEVIMALADARAAGVTESDMSWALQRALMDHAETMIDRPDNGIWEVRGEPRYFTHSRVMLWAAFDHMISAADRLGRDAPVDTWRICRDRLRQEIETHGVDPDRGCFVQSYGSTEVDASLLQIDETGFCAHDDPRMLATVAAIEHDLMRDGFVLRYRTDSGVDGLQGQENPFLACTFWLAEQYATSGRVHDAEALLQRAIGASNDLGLFAEEFAPDTGELVGNLPQALSHLTFVRAVDAVHRHRRRNAS